MPILKTEILGSVIEIDYREEEKEKLIKIINRFKSRIEEFKEVYNKISDSKIIFLAALKAEDEIEEKKKITNFDNQNLKKNDFNVSSIDKLTREIVSLKDELDKLNKKNHLLEEINSKAVNEIDNIKNKIDKINNKILSKNNE